MTYGSAKKLTATAGRSPTRPMRRTGSGWRRNARIIGAQTEAVVLDPTAGGGSIPFEALRLGTHVLANDLNPVAWLILKSTVEFPEKYDLSVLKHHKRLGEEFRHLGDKRLAKFYPAEPGENRVPDGYLWSRTIICLYCGGLVPLSPNWRLDSKGTGVRLVPHVEDPVHRHCAFKIVDKAKEHSPGTVKQGDGLCPYPDSRPRDRRR